MREFRTCNLYPGLHPVTDETSQCAETEIKYKEPQHRDRKLHELRFDNHFIHEHAYTKK